MCFRNYRLSKTWLNHSLKSYVSEPPSTFNMLMDDKHLWKLHESTFIIFFDQTEMKLFANYLLYSNSMASILFRILRICSSLFKYNDLENKKHFLKFLVRFWNLYQILMNFERKMIVVANIFPKLKTVKTSLDHSLKTAVSGHPLDVNMLKGPKNLCNLHESTFIIFSDHFERKWLRKNLPY